MNGIATFGHTPTVRDRTELPATAEAGSATIIPDPILPMARTIPAVREMQAAAMAVEAAAAINTTSPQAGTCIWGLRHRDFRPIPVCVSPQFGIT